MKSIHLSNYNMMIPNHLYKENIIRQQQNILIMYDENLEKEEMLKSE